MKVTVYVRGVDERLFDAVAAGADLAVSGWAYRALLEAAVREAKRSGIPVPSTVLEQLERLRIQASKPADRRRARRRLSVMDELERVADVALVRCAQMR